MNIYEKTETKQPWKAVNRGTHPNNPDIDLWDLEHGDCGENVVDGCYNKETADLLAAAPELLEALINANVLIAKAAENGFVEQGDLENLFLSQQKTSAAIAKAKGE